MNRIIQFVLLAITFLIYLDYVPNDFDSSFILLILILTLTSIFSHFFIRKENNIDLKKQYFKISVIFIITFSIVHFQIYIDYLLGNVDASHTFLWINNTVVSKSLIVSSLAILSYNLFYDIKPEFNFKKKYELNLKYINLKLLNFLALVLLVLYFVFIDKAYLVGGYGDYNMGGSAGYLSLFFESMINAIIILNCRNLIISGTKINSFLAYINTIKFPALLIFIYLFSVMYAGDRGPIIYNVIFIFFGYILVSKKKLTILNFGVLLIAGAFVLSLLGIARSFKDESSLIAKLQEATNIEETSRYYPQSFSPYTKELASSGRTLSIAIESDTRTYGLFALQDLMLLVPSLKGTFIEVFEIPKPLTSSAQFLTNFNLGSFSTWGVGTSCVADTYLDFGTIGVIFVFGFFGFSSRYLESAAFNNVIPSIFILVCCFSVIAYSIYIPRATILYSLNKTVYISFFVLLGVLVNKTKFR